MYLISPTYNSNKQIWDIANIKEDDVFEPELGIIKVIKEKIEEEKLEWYNFLEEKKLYKKFKKELKDKPIEFIDDENLIKYLELGFLDKKEPPEWKYEIEQPPRIAVILDDCINTEVMARRSSGLTNLCIKHRHIADGLGCSLFLLVQGYSCHDGVPKIVRENCTHLLLFRTNSEAQLLKIKSECDLPITDQEFTDMCNQVFETPYNFLFIDFSPKCPTYQFRNNFNELIIPNSIKDKCICKK